MNEKLSILSEAHQRFVLNYVDNPNATRAYMNVYPDCSYESARRYASALTAKLDIKEAIAEQFKLRAMPKEEILGRLENLAKVDIQQYIDDLGRIDIAKIKKDNIGYMIKGISDTKFGKNFTFHDSAKALETLAKVHKLFDDKTEVTVNINNEKSAEEEINDRLNSIKDRFTQPVNVGENSALTQE